ncbi:MAG: Panacea domain-containing protein [FCB group bacterium]|nr:Panacea domain-containing protein [FCB group bacterium]
MSFYFDPVHVTQAAAYLVSCAGKPRMERMKLLKLLYFADRESLREQGFPITGDTPYAMEYGPVLSRVYDYIKGQCKNDPGQEFWSKHFQTVSSREVELINDAGMSELTRYEIGILEKVCTEHEHLDAMGLSELSHEFPEWAGNYVSGTSVVIPLDSLMDALGIAREEERREIRRTREEDLEYFEGMQKLKHGLEHPSGGMSKS